MAHPEFPASWHAYRQSALEAQCRGHLATAERILADALKEAKQRGELDSDVVDHVHSLAALYCMQRNYASAERLYKLVLEAREKVLGLEHPSVVDSLEKLSVIVRETRGREEATSLGYRAMSLRANILPAREQHR